MKLLKTCLVVLSATLAAAAQATPVQLRVMETTDVHMALLNYDYYQDRVTEQYGLAKAIAVIKAARAEVPNSLLFDNGDLIQGNPLGDYVARIKPLPAGQVHPAFKVMNQLGYDAGNIGNHEFNFGLPFLRQAIATANFPYVSANVFVDDTNKGSAKPTHAFTPYVLLDRELKDAEGKSHKLRVGVIGFVPPADHAVGPQPPGWQGVCAGHGGSGAAPGARDARQGRAAGHRHSAFRL